MFCTGIYLFILNILQNDQKGFCRFREMILSLIVNSKNMSNLIGREEAYKSRISYFTCKI